jgi:hypothetical protein
LDETTTFLPIRVVDGDTLLLSAPYLPAGLGKSLYLRIHGVDCPETSLAKCPQEHVWGLRSKELVERWLSSDWPTPTGVVFCGWDKYGGRALGDLHWSNQPPHMNLSTALLMHSNENLATPYTGHGKKKDWCATAAAVDTNEDNELVDCQLGEE